MLSNGVFGDAFADLVRAYGGVPIVHRVEYTKVLDPDKVTSFLRNEAKDARVVTMVHCETPSGTLNDLKELARAVSGIAATETPQEMPYLVPPHHRRSGFGGFVHGGGGGDVFNHCDY